MKMYRKRNGGVVVPAHNIARSGGGLVGTRYWTPDFRAAGAD
jgi:hypothetical protein